MDHISTTKSFLIAFGAISWLYVVDTGHFITILVTVIISLGGGYLATMYVIRSTKKEVIRAFEEKERKFTNDSKNFLQHIKG